MRRLFLPGAVAQSGYRARLANLAVALTLVVAVLLGIAAATTTRAYAYDGADHNAHERVVPTTRQLSSLALRTGVSATTSASKLSVVRSRVAVEGGGLADDAVRAGESAYGSTPAGRPFTRHYGVETGPQRNIPGSVVDEAIDNYPGKVIEGGKTVHYDPNTNVTVVTGDGGSIVSVHKGPPPAGQR